MNKNFSVELDPTYPDSVSEIMTHGDLYTFSNYDVCDEQLI